MEQKGVQLYRETFTCSICLDLLKDPVTIPCGHTYCMNCIKLHWDEEDQRKIYSCPQCREAFKPRPVLKKNPMLAALVEQLKTGPQAAPADHCYAGPGDVTCDVCTGRKRKAFKSCLTCLASYCENHLQSHYDAPPLKKHTLVEPLEKLQENICSRHDEVMKMFCRTDHKFICYLCSVEDHKGHNTVSVAAERTEREVHLQACLQNIRNRVPEKTQKVKLLQQGFEAINLSVDIAVEDSEKVSSELIRLLQKRSSDVKQQIRSQQETNVRRVKELQEKLQQEITELKNEQAELMKLLHAEGHIQFIHNYPLPSQLSEPTIIINTGPQRYFQVLTAAVTEHRGKLQDILKDGWTNILLTEVDALLPPLEPKTRAEFLKYSHDITLDPNTANAHLLLSAGNRKAECTSQPQPYPHHPDRFTGYEQVLSKESLTGRCYWEVEWSGRSVTVAVAYEDIVKDKRSRFALSDKSWVCCFGENMPPTFVFNHNPTKLSGPSSSRVGVYLDHRAGILSFYSVSETMTLLHRVHTVFTQPLHAGLFIFYVGGTAELCKLT
ncbi:tripartite motif-containing protein 16-like [Scomber scombrus]|uniref:tripartite motif-containing protein 16-like n=1 Tax=Scomber scombrus TaxID=13677 RepID=UPI002DD864C9|nr:tripartite motif-containing protein 16-like [Scomber scombrus]